MWSGAPGQPKAEAGRHHVVPVEQQSAADGDARIGLHDPDAARAVPSYDALP